MINITSSELLDDIDQSFKISAGPGAGKTYWLTQHIKNVLQKSKKLSNNRKVVCITHTNYATENLLKNLDGVSQLEISNIHTFLYKNIIKPYLIFISGDSGFDIAKLDGHDDEIFSHYSFLSDFLQETSQQRLKDSLGEVVQVLQSLNWYLDDNAQLSLRTKYPIKIKKYPLKSQSFMEFKKLSWKRGKLHHNDVLYFSLILIEKYPFLIDALVAQYPYMFIDEFQDCDPILVEIFNRLSKVGIVLGIIGDYAQSIYNFNNTGATPQQFIEFDIVNSFQYAIEGNRRSHQGLVDFINYLRITNNDSDDFSQHSVRLETGPKPILLIGRLEALLFKFKNIENLKFIARSNQMCSVINKSYFPELSKENKNLFQELYVVDSNENRRTLVVSYIKSLEIMLLDKKIAESLKLIEKAYARFLRVSLKEKNISIKDISDQISGESIKILSSLLSDYKHFSKGTLSEFYDILLSNIGMHSPLLKDIKFSKLAKGKAKDFYNGINYLDISLCVASIEPKSKAITVHKSKGNEFDEVCLVLEEEKDLDFLLSPNILNDEEHRVYYVGASRAKNNLYIYIPELSIDNKRAIEKLGLIEIIELS